MVSQSNWCCRRIVWAIGLIAATCGPQSAVAGNVDPHNFFFGGGGALNNVGGVAIDPEGTVADVQREVRDDIRKNRDKHAPDVPEELADGLQLRKCSLRDLQAAIKKVRLQEGRRSLPEVVRYMGGMQRIQFVFVYPEENDIVVAGPGEPWRMGDDGFAVGVTTGRPVVQLEDFLVALRNVFADQPQVISCSIDPTPDGIQRMRSFVQKLNPQATARDPSAVVAQIEKELGSQMITLRGIDTTSHFAGTLVAADYRMKRLAMGLEPAPIKGMPSFLDMVGTKPLKNMMPRWWLEDHYEALLTDKDGLAWELRGAGVRAMTEDDLVSDDGSRKATGQVDPVAKRWADAMTERYDELATHQAVFGQLRNCMDAAVISALIRSEQLHDRAGLNIDLLLNSEFLPVNQFHTPREVASQASFLKKRRHLVITVSGGVQINPWAAVKRRETTDQLDSVRDDAIAPAGAKWWWN